MIRSDFHVHTVFSDGVNTPEEMVQAAIEKGMRQIGFSDHVYTYFDESYCMAKDAAPAYRAEIAALKKKYADKIDILCGIEQDMFSTESTDGYDYIIGSVHYLKVGEDIFPIDDTLPAFVEGGEKYFGGDYLALAIKYFETVADVLKVTNADIIGHLDLVSKFNIDNRYFDERDPKYLAAAYAAVDKLIPYDKPFEINTAAFSKGKHHPYPDYPILEYIMQKGGRFILSSDSHSTDRLCEYFDDFEKYVK